MGILPASKYADVRKVAAAPSGRSAAPANAAPFNIRVRPSQTPAFRDWLHRELKAGGKLQRYLEKMDKTADRRFRRAAAHGHAFQQNNDSDCRVLAHVPAHDFFRFRRVDPDFWEDNANLRKLRSDNDDLTHCIHL